MKRGNVSQILSCRSYRGAGSEVVEMDNLKKIRLPSNGLEGEIVGNPAQLEESPIGGPTQWKSSPLKPMKPSPRPKSKPCQFLAKSSSSRSSLHFGNLSETKSLMLGRGGRKERQREGKNVNNGGRSSLFKGSV